MCDRGNKNQIASAADIVFWARKCWGKTHPELIAAMEREFGISDTKEQFGVSAEIEAEVTTVLGE
jgi:hypothetical protein